MTVHRHGPSRANSQIMGAEIGAAAKTVCQWLLPCKSRFDQIVGGGELRLSHRAGF
jgi:hypothetical protein